MIILGLTGIKFGSQINKRRFCITVEVMVCKNNGGFFNHSRPLCIEINTYARLYSIVSVISRDPLSNSVVLFRLLSG